VSKCKVDNGYVIFTCPGCGFLHACNIDKSRKGPCWDFNGDLDNPTLSPSVLVTTPRTDRRCHLFMREGKIQYLNDCSHELKGQTIEMEDRE
jgi:hypothetical protein